MLGARFANARAELRGADELALPIPGVQSAGPRSSAFLRRP
jgi:hypothetical protein